MNMPHRILLTAVSVAVITAVGCDQKPAAPAKTSATPATANANDVADATAIMKGETNRDAAMSSGQLPPGHPPLDGTAPQQSAQSSLPPGHPSMNSTGQQATPPIQAAATPSGKELTYTVPETWKSEPPTSSMRKAQFVMPSDKAGDDNGQLIVYYFGPTQGGPVRMNLDRWRGMFTDDDGHPVSGDAVKEESMEVNGLKVTTLDVTGNYAAAMMPGATPAAAPETNQRMLAAIIETDEGPWFFKAVGPAKTMEAQKKNFDAFVHSVKY